MVSEMTSLNAVEDPMLMRVRRQAMTTTTPTAIMGTWVRGSTLLRIREKGVPRSRAKAQVMRDAEVMIPVAHAQVRMSTMAPMTVAPATDRTLSIYSLDHVRRITATQTYCRRSG